MLGMKGPGSGHGPDMCATMLVNQSENSIVVKRCSVQGGGRHERDSGRSKGGLPLIKGEYFVDVEPQGPYYISPGSH